MEKMSELIQNRKIRILLCVELVLLLIGVAGLFGKHGIVVGTEETDRLLGEGVSLPAGVYTARLYYDTEEDQVSAFGVALDVEPYRTLQCNFVPLYAGIQVGECQFYLLDGVEHLRVEVLDNGAESLQVKVAEIIAGTGRSRVFLFWVILGSLLLNGVLMLAMENRRQRIPAEKKLAIFGIPGLALLSSLPALVDYNMIGADLVFHLMRIEALAEHILRGELAVRIESMWLAGHGYANSVFYGDTFLLIPALYRILGFSPDVAYRLFVVTVNLATAYIAYLSFYKCFRNRLVGMFGCVLYTLMPYRIYNIYNRAAVGEYTAMIFLPLLAWGFYRIYTEDSGQKGYLWNWLIPAAGFTGIIQSHALTCEMAGVFVVFLCLFLWKKTFSPRTLQVVTHTVVMTAAINAWFLVPFLDLMMADQYYFGHNANVMIQNRGVLPAHLFYTLQAGGASSRFAETGMVDTEPIGIGMALLVCVVLWIGLCLRHSKESLTEEQRREKKAANILLFLGCVVLFMSTCYFPWDALSAWNRLFATLNGSLQFPTRLTGVAGTCMVMPACVMAGWALREKWKTLTGKWVLLLIGAVAVIFTTYQVNDLLLTRGEFIKLYSGQGVGHSAVLGAEYLPEGASLEHMTYHAPVPSEGVEMTSYRKKGLTAQAHVKADSGYIDFPMLYYKGYEARDKATGEKLPVGKGDNVDVRVEFPQGFEGEIQVRYAGMWYWHLAEAVSGLAVVGLCGATIYGRMRKRRIMRVQK